MSSFWRLVFRTAVLLLVSSALLAQSDSTPLGDVVRAPKPERRAAKVITNDQIPPRPPEPTPPLDASNSPSATTSKAAAGPAKQPGKDQISELKEHENWAARKLEQFQRLRQDGNEEYSARAIEAMIERTKRELKDVRDQLAKLPASTKAAPSELAKVTEPPNRKPEAPNK